MSDSNKLTSIQATVSLTQILVLIVMLQTCSSGGDINSLKREVSSLKSEIQWNGVKCRD